MHTSIRGLNLGLYGHFHNIFFPFFPEVEIPLGMTTSAFIQECQQQDEKEDWDYIITISFSLWSLWCIFCNENVSV